MKNWIFFGKGRKHGKKGKWWLPAFCSFRIMFSKALCFESLNEKSGLCDKGLKFNCSPFCKILDPTKFKAFADDGLNVQICLS